MAGVEFDILRVVRPDVYINDHTVTLVLGSDTIAIESIGLLGEIAETDDPLFDLTYTPVRIDGNDALTAQVVEGVGFIAATEILTLKIGGDLGSVDLAPDVSGAAIAEHIGTLQIGGDLMGTLAVTGADGDGESIASLTIRGQMGLESPSAMILAHLAAGDLRTEGSIAFLATSEVGPEVEIEVDDGAAPIGEMDITTEFAGSGDFHGNLSASAVDNGGDLHQIRVFGDLYGVFDFGDAISDFDDDTAVITVDGAFKSDARIILPANGLEGQIIFNRANDGAAWQSNAKVVVGTTELDTTQYGPTAASIGGGAAGRAEYRLHSTSCDPAEVWSGDPPTREPGVLEVEGHLELDIDGTTWVCVVDEATVVIQFYGPVSISTDDEAPVRPVKVHKWNGDSWDPITAFSVSEAPGGDQKRLAITLANEFLGGSYRVTREPGGLLSNQVDEAAPDNPAGVNAFTYYFDVVGGSCESMLLGGFDLNSDQAVTEPGDLPAWLVGPVDLNNDSLTNTNDIPSLQSAAALYGALPGAPANFPGPFVDVE